ncbi:MAG TPA: type I-C CRISPR-associated protein Cas7/Csd2 [Denitromonas sp.]|uniref:type I-C CRISPR-associated protein Cas7/Csd2 n=1 Tax=Denitromonas sp. TaxID=2734609 RepID=UPI002C539037|nr:type I-C CRISPR-associated protein Cas7/Csd2 [Zoogloeaceae bacterium]HPR05557.1 type I-C CRISPR-associated protein Cas7/Csd2 [Denitromonas sp.]HQU88482.1 type I-C CRISPR-associated protein Cas7/Csd2 [Denitromonas sp.]HQV14578.1 type I-C CRISPR-associated protein Cas7/Csd2 [Denitromonas sp.]
MALANRYDFVLVFDVKDGNPNGDPDAGNLPRLDAESGHGLVTDVSLKRKVRNFVGLVKAEEPPFEIYVKEKAVLNRAHERAYVAVGAEEELKGEDKKRKGKGDTVTKARDWMCANFFDIRTFGAVMSLGVNCGQVRGPVQLTFARSVDPIVALEHSITRMAVATEAEAEKQEGDNRTMGRKHTVPYGIYVAHGFVSSFLARQTGFSDDDLELLWQSLEQMFEHDRSAARGEMSTRGLYVFKHDSELGNAHAHALFDRIRIARKAGADVPRSFADYTVSIDDAALPAGVTLTRRVG